MASVGVRTARGRWPAAAGVRRLSDGAGPHRSQPREERARVHHMTSYYNQSAIDAAAAKPSVRLTPATIMYTGKSTDEAHLMRSATYLRKELPVRIAHRILGFRALPFIIGCNPSILQVHDMYISSFHLLNEFPPIRSSADELRYSHLLRQLLEQHKNVVSQLAEGFRACRKHIKPGHVGIINLSMRLKDVLERWAEFACRLANHKYGKAPTVRLSGHVNATLPYIEVPLDYIVPEVLKNAIRATIEAHPDEPESSLPPIHVTIANNDVDFIIRFSDRGGGVPHAIFRRVMNYNFTTADDGGDDDPTSDGSPFSGMLETANNISSGPMHGFGFGLPTARAYAGYLGGSLSVQTMQGIGTDVYLRLKHLNSRDPFRL
ncbi:3-methyl-2-oxobutanoate dehydrogenase [lipoamide] kinase, mitochondrial-like [Pollicipes pollicipes]|uniref:3-methyl-2-oxobutanoate dehydrogenase [lipoamide] kinase, mitochondrial-like n=1 Tax=Pollicipes pollicipes TaxID=41117 RepID=UPI00188574CD|nr:3-methyl-2-oxobutanoate dehydrogenase [lipoamide] kinase, mitochondrial-like [Pollicipes pollicipes]